MSVRTSIEQASLPAISALNRLPRVGAFVALLAVMLAGAFLPSVGWILLVAVGCFLGWVLYLSWPRLSTAERFMRVAVLALLGAVLLTRLLPR